MSDDVRVIGIDPSSHGFGFVVVEGPYSLIDWGFVDIRPIRNSTCMERIAQLCARYQPNGIILEDIHHRSSKRRARISKLIRSIAWFAEESGAFVERVSWDEAALYFATTDRHPRYEIAQYIAWSYPELAPYLPPQRKVWNSEDERMTIFDAAAFTFTAFGRDEVIDIDHI
jgi:hypothetical protein